MVEIISKTPIIKPEDITLDDLRYLSSDSFALWSLTSGAEIDGNKIEFDYHRYLLPIYMDHGEEIAWIKAAQLGATSWMSLRAIWWLYRHQGRKGALYMPNKELAENTSKDRIGPLMESIPEFEGILDPSDKLGLRKIGKSALYIFHLGGVSSKDSVPLDYVTFDEVRLCSPKDIDQALERISHSPYKMKVYASTSGLPNSDIDARFQDGSQHVWHSKCACSEGCDLAKTFPDCVISDDPKRPGEVYLRCPKCRWEIKDAQNGRYVPHNPGADFNSYRVSQLASKFISPKEIWRFYKRTTNMSEFYNAKLGLPYVDEENRGITMSQIKGAVDPAQTWGRTANNRTETVMGVDQGGMYCYATIADLKDGKKRLRHAEIIESRNPEYRVNGETVSPFVRLRELMNEWNVRVCVVDALPNFNDALQFAQEFPGRVFLAYYAKDTKEIVQWGDKKRYKETVRKSGPLLKFKYTCILNRFSSLDFMLGEWAGGKWITPDPDRLVQMCFSERGDVLQPESPAKRVFEQMCRLVKRFHQTSEDTGEGRYEWIYAGSDPHGAHAMNYCNVGLERLKRQAVFTFA